MAACDYYSCDVCGKKAVYDADIYERWDSAGDMAIICHECAKTHAVKVVETDPCLWTEDADGNWHTACGEVFCFITEHGPVESSMEWCCYCGRPLTEQRYEEEA